ncbi:MAG: hypothetical protein N2578_03090 [Bdellovibrionaceae bacterium]|nr:hypothetical protein [Pseudobdellovibrionaceae bacterium]
MKKIITSLAIALAAAPASATFMNIRYALLWGPTLEFAVGKFGLGVSTFTLSQEVDDATIGKYNYSARLTGALAAYYSEGMGNSSWYGTASLGNIGLKFNQTVGSTDFTADNSTSYYGVAVGYHWFWGHINLNLGFGMFTFKAGDTQLKSSSGTVGNTVPGFNFSFPMIDLGLGVHF